MIYIDEKNDISLTNFQKFLFELGLYGRYMENRSIVIKVNLTSGSYIESDSHAVTSMMFLRGLVICILESDPMKEVSIAEGDDANYGFAFLKFEHLGIPEIFDLNDDQLKRVHILDLSRDRLVRIQNPEFKYFTGRKQLWLSETLLKSGFVISLANLKTHTQTVFTGACKNMFGVLPDSNKWEYHPWIHSVVHDTVVAVSPVLSIVDGFYAMEGNGPIRGEPIDLGFRLWSDCPVEADIKACSIVGIPAGSVRYLYLLCSTLKLYDLKNKLKSCSCNEFKKKIKTIRMTSKIIVKIGLLIQCFGTHIQVFGHRVRSCNNVIDLIRAIVSNSSSKN